MKKILFILTLVLTLVLPCAQNVYAAQNYYKDKNYWTEFSVLDNEGKYNYALDFLTSKSVSVSDKPYVFMVHNFSGHYFILFSETPALVDSNGKFLQDNENLCTLIRFYSNDYDGQILISDDFYANNYGNVPPLNDSNTVIHYSNYDFCDASGNVIYSKVSFPKPQIILGTPEPVLSQVVTQENPLKEILILLPMAIPCWVGFVALRKALRILETILRTA